MIELNKIYHGNALAVLKTFADKIFNTCVTSPPYYGLRAYGTDPVIWDGEENCTHEWIDKSYLRRSNDQLPGKKQSTSKGSIGRDAPTKSDFCCHCGAWRGELGSEPSPELFIKHLVDIFREAKRTLRDDGTLWVNMGDSYWGGKGQSSQAWSTEHQYRNTLEKSQHQISGKGQTRPTDGKHAVIKPKDLIGIPWMLAFALRADGWYLRMDNIWHKPNPMPESVTDRPTKAHEYFFLLSKSQKYYYDAKAIATPYKDKTYTTFGCQSNGHGDGREKGVKGYEHRCKNADKTIHEHSGNFDQNGDLIGSGLANKKSVWTVSTEAFKEAHFATFPQELIVDCIKAGSPEGGLVLDPFGGANTTGVVSRKLNRNYVAIELKPDYIKIGTKREREEIGLFI